MDRLDIINHLIRENDYKTYAELGVFTGYTLDGCIASEKIGVDPQCGHYKGHNKVYCGTSDAFFSQLDPNKKFQIWFIDGLHKSEQVDKDIQNALKHLSPGGTIVLHDCNPSSYEMTTTGTEKGEWTGDVYKSFFNFRRKMTNKCYVVDTDYGVGIIKDQEPHPKLYTSPHIEIDWKMFNRDRRTILDLVSPEEFLKRETKSQETNEKTTTNNFSTAQ